MTAVECDGAVEFSGVSSSHTFAWGTAGDATLAVTDPSAHATGRLVNGPFAVAANHGLRTGAYSTTLTFTLSTTSP